jgi:hypothetical protein
MDYYVIVEYSLRQSLPKQYFFNNKEASDLQLIYIDNNI